MKLQVINEYELELSSLEKKLISFWVEQKENGGNFPAIIPVNDRLMLDFLDCENQGVLIIPTKIKMLGKIKSFKLMK
jgi:hypothetical protein